MKKLNIFIAGIFMISVCHAQQKPKVIVTNSEKDIIPEGIAVNNKTGVIYVTSIAQKKILAIDENGDCTDFIKPGQDGFLQGLGIKVDEKKQWVWIVSNEKTGDRYYSRVHAFDINTKKLQQQYAMEDTAKHLLNDLALNAGEKIYITDTYGAAIYELNPLAQKFHLFLEDSLIAFPNGIVAGNNGKIYIATYSHGLMLLDPLTKRITSLGGYTDTAKAFNLDGLVYYNNSIIGVYNAAENNSSNAVLRYVLNGEGDKIVSESIIDIGNQYFREPTTLSIKDNKIYVLANSYLAAYNANKESVEGVEDKLGSVVVLVYDLK